MLFNSFTFLVFILLFFSVWQYSKKASNSLRHFIIIVFSFLFYGWWDWRFLFLILFSGFVDFYAALLMEKRKEYSKLWLLLSLIANIGALAIFKYSGFLTSSLDSLLAQFHIQSNLYQNLPKFSLILPVGISFYTFQSMSYTIDVYKNRLKPTHSILHFFAYLAMFPQLVAGPIVRAKDLLQQLSKPARRISSIEYWNGLKIIIYGFFQKTVLADNLAALVNNAFSTSTLPFNSGYWWIVMIAFSLQIYFDFSGYSLIAKGLAKCMGFSFKMNFNHPYFSLSLREFWQRWHISLSSWFRDYVYIPLGGSKKGQLRSHINMWITMLISGLWHGASFMFLIWGAIHAFFLSLERLLGWEKKVSRWKWIQPIAWTFIMIQVVVAWIFFRANNLDQGFFIVKQMFSFTNGFTWEMIDYNVRVFLVLSILAEIAYLITFKYRKVRKWTQNFWVESIFMAILLTAIVFLKGPEQEFIYFQF